MDLAYMDMDAKYYIVDRYFEKVLEKNTINKGVYFVEMSLAKTEAIKKIGYFNINAFKLYFLFREVFHRGLDIIRELGTEVAAYDLLLTLINEDDHFVDQLIEKAIPVVVLPEGTAIH